MWWKTREQFAAEYDSGNEVVEVRCSECETVNHKQRWQIEQLDRVQCFHCDLWFDPKWEENMLADQLTGMAERRNEERDYCC